MLPQCAASVTLESMEPVTVPPSAARRSLRDLTWYVCSCGLGVNMLYLQTSDVRRSAAGCLFWLMFGKRLVGDFVCSTFWHPTHTGTAAKTAFFQSLQGWGRSLIAAFADYVPSHLKVVDDRISTTDGLQACHAGEKGRRDAASLRDMFVSTASALQSTWLYRSLHMQQSSTSHHVCNSWPSSREHPLAGR